MKHMTKDLAQMIYKRAKVERMMNALRSGEVGALESYFNPNLSVNEEDLFPSTIKVSGKAPILKTPDKDPVSADLENAIMLHQYYQNLDETQASDPRLWTYLSHVQFRKYALIRWGLKGKPEDFEKQEEKAKAITYIFEHWFVSGGSDRDLRRHAIARLWWAAHLTCAPWKSDPEFFSGLENKDPYYYTRILLSTQDIYQQVLERAMGRSNRILISVLEFLGKNKSFAQSREKIRSLMKELNLAYGTKKIITLDQKTLAALISKIGSEIDVKE